MIKNKLAIGVAWLGAAKVIVNFLGIISTLILARLLTPEDFGLVALATTMLTIIGSVTELSLASALIHHKDPTDLHFNTAWTLNLCRAVIVGLIFCAAAPLASNAYHEPRLLDVMLVIGGSVILSGFNNPKTVILTRRLVFWQEFVMTVTQKLVGFIVGIAIALVYKSYWALVGGIVASQIIGIIVSYVIIPFRPKFAIIHAKELWSFSIWLTFGKIVNTLNWNFDQLLVGAHLGKATLGFYSVGDKLAGMSSREIIGPLETTLFPAFSQIRDDNSRLQSAYKTAQTLIFAIALPLGVGFALVAHSVVLLLMGVKWLPAVEVIQIIAVTVAFQTLSAAAQPLAMAQGETKFLFQRDLISFLIRVPLIIIGLMLGGLIGLLYGRAISTFISISMNMFIVRRLIRTSIIDQVLANARSFISILIMIGTVLMLQHFIGSEGTPLILTLKITAFILLGGLAYVLTSLIIWFKLGMPHGPETQFAKLLAKSLPRAKY
ncbi:MAG: lipopolysaccharide biosynthesis protein [Methylotenera sp.]|uniref:lipopolysaccharide biosynthesis protein n=1 Tax=Methylotenera sp. TaxID=2051956 RepID=UPI0024893037|nr:lipopolysaccharide biosynthesis protein [Methylotenera sp.]MDI1309670.1 lipopolysaccharide biosynthesis protein [Methylotenera sp.]